MPQVIQNPPIVQYAIHHTASFQNGRPQIYAVNRFHKNKNWGTEANPWYQPNPGTTGWWVVYNYFIDVDGTIYNTRVVGEETLANRGHNCDIRERCDTISICLAGDFNAQTPTNAQVVSLRKLIKKLEQDYPTIGWVFHKDIQNGRTCPGRLYTHDFHRNVVLQENIDEPDDEDAIKKAQIAQLQKLVDQLRVLLAKLWRKRIV